MTNKLFSFKKTTKIFLFLLLCMAGITRTFAYDFSAVAPSGQTLYFTITDNSAREVSLTYPNYREMASGSNSSYHYYTIYYWYNYAKPSGEVVIPENVEYNGVCYTVTSISAHAFGGGASFTITSGYSWDYYYSYASECTGITSITIPNSVRTIGGNAFYGCTGLSGLLTIPNSVTSIGSSAFGNCSNLTSVDIPNSLTSISNSVFQNCGGLTSVNIPNTVTSIGDSAFSGCSSLTSVIIPNSVTSLGGSAFQNCSVLTSVTIGSSVTSIGDDAFNGCSGLTLVTIGNSVTSIGKRAFRDCSGLTEIVSLRLTPPTVYYSYTYPSYSTFYNVNKSIPVYVPAESLSAYQNASGWDEFTNYIEVNDANFTSNSTGQTLYYELLDMVTHEVTVAYPGSSALAPWEGFEQPTGHVIIPETVDYQGITYTVRQIKDHAFYGCSGITQVTIGENITYVGPQAFWNCPNLETVNYNAINCDVMYTRTGSGTTSSPYVYYSVFSSDASGGAPALARVTIGSSVQHIPNYAFKDAENIYQRLVIPVSVNEIGNYAFYNCNSMVQMIIQGEGLQTIGDYAFYGCSALQTTINLPNSVLTVGNYAFTGCTHVPSLTIGEGTTSIGQQAFWNCPLMVTVNFNAVNCTTMYTKTGSGTSSSPYVYRSVFNSDTTAGNATPITTLNIGANVTNIPDYAFKNSPNAVHNLVLPEGLLNIGQYAFHSGGFTGDLPIPNTTQTIGQYAFYGCEDITALTIGESVASVGDYSFWSCPALATVNFNAVNCTTMNTAGSYSVFNSGTSNGGTTPITALTIGNNVTNIPDYAFYNSPNIDNELPLPNSLINIGQFAFYNCSSLTGSLLIPNTVSNIGQYAFYDCSSFDGTLTLSNSLDQIEQYTFHGCSGLHETLVIPNSVLTIANNAFEDCSGFSGHLNLHNALSSLGGSAFYGCSNLAELTIGEGMTTIGGSAFWNCPAIQTVHFNATNCTSMNTNSQYSVFNSGTTDGGQTPIITLSIGENVTRIPDYAFRNSVNATSDIIIPNATTYIGTYAFFGFRSPLLTIGEGVSTIGQYAFWYCPLLQTVNYNAVNCTQMYTRTGAGTTASPYVYYSVFSFNINASGTPSILALHIGKHVQTIPDYAFKGSSNISNKLLFPNVLTSIGVQSFYECSSIVGDLVLPNAVTSVGEYAFFDCHGFDGSLVIGSGISTINQYTFADCTGFTGALIIGRSVSSIGAYAFRNCSAFSNLISEFPTPPTAESTSFNNMTYTIPVHVPYAKIPAYQAATGWSSFTNYKEQFVFDQLSNDSWSDTQNWYAFELPTANDVVCVNSNCQMDIPAEVLHLYVLNLNDALTINSGQTLTTTYGIGTLQPSQLIITDGAQLVNPISNAYGTVQRNVNGYSAETDNWFVLGTPIYEGTETNTIATGTYDLFYYSEPTHYWMNEKMSENGFTMLEPAKGYLYANQAQQTIAFEGQINASNAEFSVPVTYEGSPLAGYTLVGNPYTNNLNIGDVKLNGTPLTTYYRISDSGGLVAYTAADPIHPGEGFLVMASAGGTLTFAPVLGRNHMVNMRETIGDEGPTRGFRVPNHGDMTNINAYSSENTYTIAATVNPAESGTVQGMGTYGDGTICTLIATANEGYTFVNWTENGNQVSLETSYSFTVNGDRTLVANFVSDDPNTYNITATANPSAGGTVTGSGSYDEGTTCTLTATANTGYVFNNWTKNGTEVSSSATYSFTVTEAGDYVANFEVQGEITNHWTPVPEGLYSQSTTIKGVILFNGVEQFSNQLELGIFCGDECRGSAIASEFFITHRFIADVNVYGENGHQLSFRLYDHIQGMELNYTPPANIVFTEDGYGEWMDPLALNFTSLVEISATVDPADAGVVTGEGNYAIGASCTLIATANEGYQFAYWTLNDVEVSTNPTFSFTVAEAASYVAHFQYVHSRSLVEGWNWWSTFIEQEGINGLEMLENSLGASGIRIQGKNASVDRIEYEGNVYWYGSLNSINNEQMYKIRTNSACSATVVGDAADLGDHSITINSGWNWIGFPSSQSLSVETAMSGFTPEANDVIKGRGGSTTYLSTGEYNLWYGTLTTLEPGQGYMYKSNSSSSKTLTFQSGRNGEAKAVEESSLFEPMVDNYANNMLITAVVEINDEELRSDDFELAAFVGNECRGSVRLMYVEPLDRYVAFLLVFGDVEEPLHFVLTDGYDEYDSEELMTYVSDGLIGKLTEPATLHFGTLGINDDGGNGLVVFPNPSHDVFNIEGTDILKIEVTDIYGQVILAKEMAGQHIQINLNGCAAGTYLLRILTNNEIVTSKLIQY